MNSELNDLIYKDMYKTMKDLFEYSYLDNNITATSFNESLNLNALKELEDLIKENKTKSKFLNLNRDFNDMIDYDIKNEILNNTDYKYSSRYGIPILKPTKTILVKVQKRKHKKKRINKKYIKKYGYVEIKKEVPYFYGIITTC